jgi:CheY-like chemotaxis protein
MDYKVLVIDDDEPIHFMVKALLGKEFNLVHAKNAQEAIDILSKEQVNLILSDIHMPGLTGLELLESLRQDEEKKNIPVLIMTNLPTVEKERKALDLGAADFIKKGLFNTDKERILELVRMKLVTDVHIHDLEKNLADSKNRLVMELMESALQGSFDDTVEVLSSELLAILDVDFLGVWVVKDNDVSLIKQLGSIEIPSDISDTIESESSFQKMKGSSTPYLSNHVFNGELGLFTSFSKEHNLAAEIAVPLYSVNEKSLLMNNLKVPTESKLFSVIVLKRSVLFSTTEYELISRLLTQAGSILWRLFKKNLGS